MSIIERHTKDEKIAVRQLELRKENRLASDKRVANVVSLCKQFYDEASWPERGELFLCLMADDSWSTVATLVDEDAVDDLGLVHFWEKIEQQYGKLTLENTVRNKSYPMVIPDSSSATPKRISGFDNEPSDVIQ